MKPNQLGIMMREGFDRIAIVERKPKTTNIVRDVTVDFTLMIVAELKRLNTYGMVNDFTAKDAYGNEIVLRVTCELVSEKNLLDEALPSPPNQCT